jgi:hypothetical protein
MASALAKVSSLKTLLRPRLSVGEQLDVARYEESLGDFIAAA